jgi:hypothetical protein
MGYLGTSPRDMTVAFSLDVLEVYHRLRRRHPQLSIEAFVRAICDVQEVRVSSLAFFLYPS